MWIKCDKNWIKSWQNLDKKTWTDLLKLAAAFLPPLLLFQWVLLCLLILFVPCWKEREKNECIFKETSALMYVCRTLTIAWILHKYVQFRGCQNNDWPKPCNKALRCNPIGNLVWIYNRTHIPVFLILHETQLF